MTVVELLDLFSSYLHTGGELLRDSGSLRFQVQDYRGAVSELVAATLQTKGIQDQAKILVDFREALDWLAALAWLAAISLAVGSYAVFGEARNALYLLIGPPLFYYMITTTVQTDGVRVRVGEREVNGSVQDQNEFMRFVRLLDDGQGNAQQIDISLFFAIYDSIVTEMVQGIVGVLLDTENRDDLRFKARERALSFVLQGSSEDQGYFALVGTVNFGECGRLMNQQLRVGALNPKTDEQKEDVEETKRRLLTEWTKPTGAPLDFQTRQFLVAHKDDIEGLGDVPIDDPSVDLAVSCETVWRWTRAATLALAEERLTPEAFHGIAGDNSEIPWNPVFDDIQAFLRQDSAPGVPASQANAATVLAAYIYRNAMTKTTHQAMQSQIFGRAPFNAQRYDGMYDFFAEAEAHGGFFKLKYFAGTVQYIQGVLLYLLSIGFPFFAIFLVMPGRAMSFLVWCALWAWVKSWDVGFAIVHVARDIFWHVLSGRVNKYGEQLDWDTPWSIFQVINHNDPLASQNTYWEITSLLTVAVPFLTAHLFLGASGMFQAFSYGIDKTGDRLARQTRAGAKRWFANQNEILRRNFINSSAAQEGLRAFHAGQGGIATGHQARTFVGTPISQGVTPEVSKNYRLQSELANAQRALGNLAPGTAAHQAQQGVVDDLKKKVAASAEAVKGAGTGSGPGMVGNQDFQGLSGGARYFHANAGFNRGRMEIMMASESWAEVMAPAERLVEAQRQLGALGDNPADIAKKKELQGEISALNADLEAIASRGTHSADLVTSAQHHALMYAGLPALYSDPERREWILDKAKQYRHYENTLAMFTNRVQFTELEGNLGGGMPQAFAIGRMKNELFARGMMDGNHTLNQAPMARDLYNWMMGDELGGDRYMRPGWQYDGKSPYAGMPTAGTGGDPDGPDGPGGGE